MVSIWISFGDHSFADQQSLHSRNIFAGLIRFGRNNPFPFVVSQVRPAHRACGLCRVSDALYAHRSRGEDAAAVREGATALGGTDGRRSVHDDVQQDRTAASEDDDHGLHGQL